MNKEMEILTAKVEILTIKINDLLQSVSPNVKDFLSVKETAKYLQCSESLVYKLIESNSIQYHKPNNGRVFIKRESLITWIETNGSI
jgi:excisionase family DNA binding protein